MSVQTDNGIAVLSKAERMLAEVVSAQDAIDIIDMAEAARVWAQRAKLGTASINHATAIKLKAEIKLADCVDEGQRRGEIATAATGGGRPVTSPQTGPVTSDAPATLDDIGVSKQRLHESRKIRDAFTPEAIDEIVESANLQDKEIARKEFVQQRAHVSYNGGENEWYTPVEYVDAAKSVFQVAAYPDTAECQGLGDCEDGECRCPESTLIDVDPASNPQAQTWISAGTFFTKDDSGLDKEWHGTVWMNPPYAQPLISQFCEKVCAEYEAGRVSHAIVLVNNGTETKWGQRLIAAASAVCFPSGRIKFIDQNGQPSGAPLQGQMFVYLGDDADAFAAEFSQFGTVLRGR